MYYNKRIEVYKDIIQKLTKESLHYFMSMALVQARKANDLGEIPIGAVLLVDKNNESKYYASHNRTERDKSPLLHAEYLVIKRALEEEEGRYLNNSVLFTTLEPCPYCAGAIWLAKIPTIYFGAYDKKAGAAGSIFNIIPNEHLNHKPDVYGGIMEEECSVLLKDFFKSMRTK